MKTIPKSLTLDTQFAHFYRPLGRNLMLTVVTTLILAAVALVYFDERLVRSLSEQLIVSSTRETRSNLRQIFTSAETGLRLAQREIESLRIDEDASQAGLFRVLAPFLDEFDTLDSINIADHAGNEFVLIKRPGEIVTRRIRAGTPDTAIWRRWQSGETVEEWTRSTDIRPQDRPWFRGALERAPGESDWTAPYAFLTTKEPGVSVSGRWTGDDSDTEYVAAFNIALTDISRHTTRMRPSGSGMTVVFTNDGQTIGLPPDPRFQDDKALLSAVLSPVTELGIPAIDAALEGWETRDRAEGIFSYRTPDRSLWWVGLNSRPLDADTTVWLAVIIPERDFLGSLATLRNLSLGGIGLVGLLIAGVVFVVSMRSIRGQVQAAVDHVERRLGQYQLKQKIGEGGNGAVYRAKHALLRRPTAIKLMNPAFARSDAARTRFEHEVQITSNLSHPNTIAIYDYGHTPDDTLYYAMEFLTGGTLERLVQMSGPLPAGRAIYILAQIAGSLAEAHDKGLIHRDIKPSNAMLCERGGLFDVVKVLDFGLVKEISETDGNLTQTNLLVGTPLYMAPEIISRPGQAGPHSDLYALGAVGYVLITGGNVFEGESAVEICAAHLNDPPIAPSERLGQPVAEDLEGIVLSCLAKDPADRPSSAAALRDALLACRDSGSWSQRQAQEWWRLNSATFTGVSLSDEAAPMSNTQILIDMDSRVASGNLTGSDDSG